MWMHDPRTLILRALLLDAAGQLLILGLILWIPSLLGWPIGGSSLEGQGGWLLFSLLLYPPLGWLFGSYTVLRWRRLTLPVLLQRLVITAAVSVMVAPARWVINPADGVAGTGVCSWCGCWASPVGPCWCAWRCDAAAAARRPAVAAGPAERHSHCAHRRRRVPHRQRLSPVDALRLQRRLEQPEQPLLVAVSASTPGSQPARVAGELGDARSPRRAQRVGAQPV